MTIKLRLPPKAPDEVLDYTYDWVKVLRGDRILSSVWSATGLGITANNFTNTTATAFIAGGTANTTYNVENTVTTEEGRTFVRTGILLVDFK